MSPAKTFPAPPPEKRPPCNGCDRCTGEDDGTKLYAWTGRRWVCHECYYSRRRK